MPATRRYVRREILQHAIETGDAAAGDGASDLLVFDVRDYGASPEATPAANRCWAQSGSGSASALPTVGTLFRAGSPMLIGAKVQ